MTLPDRSLLAAADVVGCAVWLAVRFGGALMHSIEAAAASIVVHRIPRWKRVRTVLDAWLMALRFDSDRVHAHFFLLLAGVMLYPHAAAGDGIFAVLMALASIAPENTGADLLFSHPLRATPAQWKAAHAWAERRKGR